jgi:S-layer protein
VSFEVSTLTFSDLIAGQSVTVADYTLTATGNVSAAEVAAAFNGSAPVNSSFTGSLASWTVTSVSGAEVSFTHSVVGNVADLAATTAGVTAVAAVAEVVGVEAVAGVAEVVGVEAVFSHSTLAAMDTMTGFVIGTDKIDLLGLADAAVGAPNAMIRVADIDTSDDLAATLDTAFNGSAANQAGLVIISAGTAAGTYLYVNDATVDYSTTADVFIKLIGLTGTVGDVNTDLNVSDYFAV